jgi:hypothetical protein
MTDSIGLSELIEKVRQELLPDPNKEEKVPLLYVDSIELELNVTVKQEANGSLKICVVDLGGKASIDKGQIIKVKLSPLLGKEEILENYKVNQPKKYAALVRRSGEEAVKGDDDITDA